MTKKKTSVTIREVAAQAGVSVATVSRYLNQKVQVSPEVTARLARVTDELHYEPLATAQQLASSLTKTIPGRNQVYTSGRMQMLKQVGQVLLTMQRYSWEQGVAAQAFLELGETDTAILLVRDAVQRQSADGRLALMHTGESVTDPAANGEALFNAASLTREPVLQAACEAMLNYLLKAAPRAADGTLFHIKDSHEIWVDSLYMAPPFLAVAGDLDEALRQIHGMKNRLWNTKNKLYAHIWDEDRQVFKRAAHWGVGNGWAAAGLSRVIRILPESRTNEKQELVAHLKDLLDGCLAYQRPDGLFHDVIDNPETFVETNLAQMLAYTIFRGIAGGWLPPDYKIHADRMRTAAHKKVDASGYVQGVCGAPAFDRAGTAPEGQAFFLLMEAAWKETL
jgi:unsaturated rhamnogalacturonyl hydrolase